MTKAYLVHLSVSVWPLWKYVPLCDLLSLFPQDKEELMLKYGTVKDAQEVDNVTGQRLGYRIQRVQPVI